MIFRKPLNKLRYPIENNKAIIDIKVTTVRQLFDERDPAPFRDKSLDDDAAEYIVTSALEITPDRIGMLRIYIEESIDQKTIETIKGAVTYFFQYEMDLISKKVAAILSIGFKSLLIGIIFLTASVAGSLSLEVFANAFWKLFFREGFLLVGWVSMWKPINVFLYEWWPLMEIRSVYKKLGKVDIEIKQMGDVAH